MKTKILSLILAGILLLSIAITAVIAEDKGFKDYRLRDITYLNNAKTAVANGALDEVWWCWGIADPKIQDRCYNLFSVDSREAKKAAKEIERAAKEADRAEKKAAREAERAAKEALKDYRLRDMTYLNNAENAVANGALDEVWWCWGIADPKIQDRCYALFIEAEAK
jgi:hypothetical protein